MRTHCRLRFQSDSIGPAVPPIDATRFDQESAQSDRSLPWVDDRSGWDIEKIGDHPVGLGGYADVWKAKVAKHGCEVFVALKVLRRLGSDRVLQQRLEREVRCWKPLEHENIAPLLSVHTESHEAPAIVLPWYKNGTADVYLKEHQNINPINIICEIACSIEYLHAKGIIHGDLKGANIMIDDTGHARLIDFGLARRIDSEEDMTTTTTSSICWCAPELICTPGTRTSKASDVYAFASTVLELLTGAVPYVKLPPAAVYGMVVNGVNPRHHSNPLRYDILRPDLLWQVLERCWSEPSNRPTISDVKQILRLFDT